MDRPFVPVRIAVLTVSDTRTLENDTSGDYIEETMSAAGHEITGRTIVADTEGLIRRQLAEWVADTNIDVIIATGGTGLTPRDVTPDAMRPLVTKHIPGFGEMFRYLSIAEIGMATIQSRADAALCNQTFVFLLPGSTGGVKLGVDKILVPQLDNRTKPCNFTMLLPRIKGTERG